MARREAKAAGKLGAKRQMLHAGVLGFIHPVTGANIWNSKARCGGLCRRFEKAEKPCLRVILFRRD